MHLFAFRDILAQGSSHGVGGSLPGRHSPAMNVINPPRPQRELDNVDEVVNWVILLLFRTGYVLYRSIARYEDN